MKGKEREARTFRLHHRALRRAWQEGWDNLGYQRIGTFVVSPDVAAWLIEEEEKALTEIITYGLPVRSDDTLPPLTEETSWSMTSAYVEAKEVG